MVNKEELLFGKVIYLDEQAIMDFLELNNDGDESKVIKKVSESVAAIEAEASVGKGFFDFAKIRLSGNAAHKKNNLVETRITSTIISSFKKVIDSNNTNIISLTNVNLFIYKDSPAYYRNLVPVLNMIDDISKLSTLSAEEKANFDGLKIQEMERTLDLLSGYYEFICEDQEGKKMITRFNISGLRNNYTLQDLTKMDLHLFGIQVGTANDANLEFGHMMDNIIQEKSSNMKSEDFDEEQRQEKLNLRLPIIDILMAGV
ncbi:DUF6414 family protein [Enterococcus mediterraneensis]|uniref:DUF6414 family protein n=1 Tax=Enterococcus mediterraneensis TaxID=2364791 RepID=UPI000F070BEF|nr:DUF6414 family protein [Enterococcus mediterraneensis]